MRTALRITWGIAKWLAVNLVFAILWRAFEIPMAIFSLVMLLIDVFRPAPQAAVNQPARPR